MTWTLTGGDELVVNLKGIVAEQRLRPVVEEAARLLLAEAKRLAPRDTGELEDAIVILEMSDGSDTIAVQVGVPQGDPAFARGMATEWGTASIVVGSPDGPRVTWKAKSKSTASMPWLRAAMVNVAPQVAKLFAEAMRPTK